jgi:hypothetical protein
VGDSYTIDDAKQLCERANVVSFDFLMQELELGVTFCRIALGFRSERDYQTHRLNADKASQTALRQR